MKISKTYLIEIIKEETQKALNELSELIPEEFAASAFSQSSRSADRGKANRTAAKARIDRVMRAVGPLPDKMDAAPVRLMVGKKLEAGGRWQDTAQEIYNHVQQQRALARTRKDAEAGMAQMDLDRTRKDAEAGMAQMDLDRTRKDAELGMAHMDLDRIRKDVEGAPFANYGQDYAKAIAGDVKDLSPAGKKRRTKASRQAGLSKRIGRTVANIQNRLRKYFPIGSRTFAGGQADGKYGRPGGETESAIKRFQKDYMKDTKPDGLWGPGTEKGYKKVKGRTKSGLMLPPTGTEPQKGKPQKSTAVAKLTGIKSIEQLKKERADALKYAQVAYRGGYAEETKAKASERFKVASRALELAQAQEKIGKQQGLAKARGETGAERDTAIARAPGRGK